MSNTTSSPAKSLQRGETPPKPEYAGEVTEQDVFPFLVHSQDSVTKGEGPEVDNAKLARQKRKRTSPEDQATLEAEYKKNPKPDKAARLAIVNQVCLGEKEVQIWFQNRRQNTRRKSRPLLPHEIAAFGLVPAGISSSPAPVKAQPPSSSFNSRESFSSSQAHSSQEMACASQTTNRSSSDSSSEDEQHPSSSPQFKEPTTISLQTPAPGRTTETSLPTFTPLKPSLSFGGYDTYSYAAKTPYSKVLPQPTPGTGYLANRWNMSSICGTPNTQKAQAKFMTPSTNQKGGFMTPGDGERDVEPHPTPSSAPLPINFNNDLAPTPPSNNVRLSLSLDGRAELVSADMSSSPPRPMPPQRPTSALNSIRRTPGLQRSLSATAAVPFSLSRQSAPAQRRTPLPSTSGEASVPRLPTGRSRDASQWQLCADADARDELTMMAENEGNGSAVAAISLIRSTSGKALKTNNNKRNAPSSSVKEKVGSGKKVKRTLGRAATALGRLQSGGNDENRGSAARKAPEPLVEGEKRKVESAFEIGSPGDSDKENWLPGEAGTTHPSRTPLPGSRFPRNRPGPTPSKAGAASRREKESGSTPLMGRNRNRGAAQKAETKIFEDEGSDDGREEENRGKKQTSEEVERFMRGASPGKKGDLDCIQGLLSLSQGNWR